MPGSSSPTRGSARRIISTVAILLVWLVHLFTHAVAQAIPAGIKLTPDTGPRTEAIRVRGHGFGMNEAVDLSFDDAPAGVVNTDAQGRFWSMMSIPRSARPGAHIVTAVGELSGLVATAEFLVRTDWAQFQFDPAHTGFNRFENVIDRSNVGGLMELWSASAGSEVGPPTVADGRVFVQDSGVVAYDARFGRFLWAWDAGGLGSGLPVEAGGIVYAVSFSDSHLYALDAATGQQLWISQQGSLRLVPVVDHGVVYVTQEGGGISAFDAQAGELLWSTGLGGLISRSVAVQNGVVFAVISPHKAVALDAFSGAELWHNDSLRGDPFDAPAVADGVVYAATQFGGLYALDASTGSILWGRNVGGGYPRGPTVAYGLVYVAGGLGVEAFESRTGALRWVAESPSNYAPVAANGVVYAASTDGLAHAWDARDGSPLWSSYIGLSYGGATIADATVYVGGAFDVLAYGLP